MEGVGTFILAFSLRKPSDSTRQLHRLPQARHGLNRNKHATIRYGRDAAAGP